MRHSMRHGKNIKSAHLLAPSWVALATALSALLLCPGHLSASSRRDKKAQNQPAAPTTSFGSISTGTNTSATMTVGTGATLTYSGGTVNASECSGANCALAPNPSDGVQYVSSNGSNTDDGLSWGTAKATVSAAISALPLESGVNCGTIHVGAGTYPGGFVLPRCVSLIGQAVGSPGALPQTEINFTNTTGAGIAIGDSLNTDYPTGEIKNIAIQGPGTGTNTTGLYFGGDPGGAITPSTDRGAQYTVSNVDVFEFGTGISFGNNAYLDTFFHVMDHSNGLGITCPSGLTNAGENIRITDSEIYNNTSYGVYQTSCEMNFSGTSFDFNNGGTGTQFIDSGQDTFSQDHFEQNSGANLEVASGQANIFGGMYLLDSSTGTDTAWILMTGNSPQVALFGGIYDSNHPVTNIVTGSSLTNVPQLTILYPNWNGTTVTASTNLLSLHVGPHIVTVLDPGHTTYIIAGQTLPATDRQQTIALFGYNGISSKTISLTAGTATWTFATAYSNAPDCTAVDNTAANAVRVEPPTTSHVRVDGTSTDMVTITCTPAAN